MAVSMQYILLAEASTVLMRTLNLLFTVTLVFSVRVTRPPSFTMYTSGSKYTPATASEGRGTCSEVSRKWVTIPSNYMQPYLRIWPIEHVQSNLAKYIQRATVDRCKRN